MSDLVKVYAFYRNQPKLKHPIKTDKFTYNIEKDHLDNNGYIIYDGGLWCEIVVQDAINIKGYDAKYIDNGVIFGCKNIKLIELQAILILFDLNKRIQDIFNNPKLKIVIDNDIYINLNCNGIKMSEIEAFLTLRRFKSQFNERFIISSDYIENNEFGSINIETIKSLIQNI